MHPMDFFENPPLVKAGHCFVMMPFKDELAGVLSAIDAALSIPGLDVVVHRADEVLGGGPIMTDVVRHLAEAELVIVDLTGANPNVFYELGIAHAVRCAESVLLITQSLKDVPFDVKSYRCIEYTQQPDGLRRLQDTLAQFVTTEILPTRFLIKVAEGETWSSEKVLGNDRSLYSFAICDVILGRDAVQFRLEVFRHGVNRQVERVYSELQPGLRLGERVSIPTIPYALKVDEATSESAALCVCRPESA